jgi:SAM-dependent methyltransferase
MFDDLTDIYESMVDWSKRLAHETPFYRRLFADLNAKSVLDAACGTGHHAAMFHGWGLRVEGADISQRMIQQARGRHGEQAELRWHVRAFDEPVSSDSPFDVAICVGNSLALAADSAMVRTAIDQLMRAVAEGGAVVLHILNLWHLPDGPSAWQKCFLADRRDERVLVLKGIHRCGDRGYIDLLMTRGLDGRPALESHCTELLGLEADQLSRWALRAGARHIALWGGYAGQPYDRASSADLVLVAGK